jgi:hypothetical protein
MDIAVYWRSRCQSAGATQLRCRGRDGRLAGRYGAGYYADRRLPIG